MNFIITGASNGIGYELVKRLSSSKSHYIIAIARNEEKLLRLRDECHIANPEAKVYPLSFDLSAGNYEHHLLPLIIKHFQVVDVLVNNAGVLINKEFTHLSDDDFDLIFDVNVKAVFKLVRLLFDKFNKPAHIVNIGSMGGVQGSVKFPGLSIYSASKGAVAILTEALAEELKDTGITINCLAYGAVQTEMLSKAFPDYKAPLQADDMAGFVEWFVLNGQKYFNGKILPVSCTTP